MQDTDETGDGDEDGDEYDEGEDSDQGKGIQRTESDGLKDIVKAHIE